jgi:hypothetical protein
MPAKKQFLFAVAIFSVVAVLGVFINDRCSATCALLQGVRV